MQCWSTVLTNIASAEGAVDCLTMLPSIVGENQGFQGSPRGARSGNNSLMQKIKTTMVLGVVLHSHCQSSVVDFLSYGTLP
jgi:hypothetical protein